MQELRGHVAVVTGGASGIGLGMAKAFAAEGMRVVIGDIEDAAREEAVASLGASGAEAIGVACDVSDFAQVEALREAALDAFGAVNVLCNNAGVAGGSPGAIWEADPDEWDWVMGVNLRGVVNGLRAFVPALLTQAAGGHIINTASLAGLMHGAGIYGVSKQACVGLSETLWRELRATGKPVSASVLCPAWVRTRIMESERNRPESPRPEAEVTPEAQLMRNFVAGLIENGLDPEDVGRQVVDATKRDRFYILTHPSWNNVLEGRFQTILEGQDPIPVPPQGEGSPFA